VFKYHQWSQITEDTVESPEALQEITDIVKDRKFGLNINARKQNNERCKNTRSWNNVK